MRDRLLGLAEQAEAATLAAVGVLDDADIAPLRHTIRTLRIRLGYPEGVVVAALAGGTGSGKSSILNSVAGEVVAEVGGVRPTTQAPAAIVPEEHAESLAGLLEEIGVDDVTTFGGSVCLIDLPDYDSVEVNHRATVDGVLPMVDVVIWVADPEKYRDARFHHDYLQRFRSHADRFLFVLNQTDRLPPDEVGKVVEDFETALAEDGLQEASVLAMSALPPSGPAVGVDSLESALIDLEDREVSTMKLATDLSEMASELASRLGSGLDFDARAEENVSIATDLVVEGDLYGATRKIVRFLEEVAGEVGGPVGASIRSVAADTPLHLARIVEENTDAPARGRFGRVAEPPPPSRESISTAIRSVIVRPVRAHLAKRGLAVAAITEFVVGAQSLNDPAVG